MRLFKEKIKKLYVRLRYEVTPFGFIRNFILFPIGGFMRVNSLFGANKPYDEIKKLNNRYQGKRCFIIATGPSLKISDVEMLKDEITIGVNTIFNIYDRIDWRPTYYVMTDPVLHKNLNMKNKLNFDDYAEINCILNALCRKYSVGDKVIYVNTCWLDHCYNFGKSRKFKYNSNLLFGVYDYYSVTQEAIVYAIYMGFSEIYLLGVDNDYLGKKQHFTETVGENTMSIEQAIKNQRSNNWGYEFIKKIADNHKIKIFNATRGGALEIFPRVNLEDVLQKTIDGEY